MAYRTFTAWTPGSQVGKWQDILPGLCVIGQVEKQRPANVAEVTRFVRETIGCSCPDEVFHHIEVRRGSSAVKSCSAECELRVGGRLLIVVTSERVKKLSARLEQVMSEGKQARDASQFNRFRLVVRTDGVAKASEQLFPAFEGVSVKDDRMHLHVLGKAEVPDFLA